MTNQTVELDKVIPAMNKSEIHRKTGISLSHISRVLSFKRNPSTRTLRKLARELGVTMDELDGYLSRKRSNTRPKLVA